MDIISPRVTCDALAFTPVNTNPSVVCVFALGITNVIIIIMRLDNTLFILLVSLGLLDLNILWMAWII